MRTASIGVAIVAALLGGCSAPDDRSAGQADFMTGIEQIDGRLSADRATTLRLADEICAELAKGRSVEDVAGDAQRFTKGEGTISHEQASRLVEQAKEHVCP